MKEKPLKCNDIKIITPYKIIKTLELKVIIQPNEHGVLLLNAIIETEDLQQTISSSTCEDKIELKYNTQSGESKIIFKGKTSKVNIQCQRGINYLNLEAKSYTFDMDIEKKERSFQDENKTYKALIDEITKENNGNAKDEITKGEVLKKFLVQYKETNWEFIKRIASGFNNSPIIPDVTDEKPRYYVGLPKTASYNLEGYNYEYVKSIDYYQFSKQNYEDNLQEKDIEKVEIQTYLHFNIGDEITLNQSGIILRVKTVTGELERGLWVYKYILTNPKAIRQNFIPNTNILGVSLSGEIIQVSRNTIKVLLDIDKENPPKVSKWFGYQAEGNNAWYLMPQIKSRASLYFPTVIEDDASTTSSIRTAPQESKSVEKEEKLMGDPKEKSLLTAQGKEVNLRKEDINISTKEGTIYINMHTGDGIKIESDKQLIAKAEKEIKIGEENKEGTIPKVKKIEIIAEDELILEQKSSSIIMNEKTNSTKSSIVYIEGSIKSPMPTITPTFETPEEEAPEEEKGSLLEQFKNADTDTKLDALQLGLDVVGMIPVVGCIADVGNAIVSAARGDWLGAGLSLVSAIPGVGDLFGAFKAGKKALSVGAKVASKVVKAVQKTKAVQKVVKVAEKYEKVISTVKAICKVYDNASTVKDAYYTAQQIKELYELYEKGELDLNDLDTLIHLARTGVNAFGFASALSSARNKNKNKKDKDNGNDKKNKKDKDTPKEETSSSTKEPVCKNDPINVVTGSFLIHQTDIVLEDTNKDFIITRNYESIYANKEKLLGSKWLMSIQTNIEINDEEAVILLPDMRIEKFENIQGVWHNKRNNDDSYILITDKSDYILKSVKDMITYKYNQYGNIEIITDKNNNKTKFYYLNTTDYIRTGLKAILDKIVLSSGQTLSFEYKEDKLSIITDNIGRKTIYEYDGELLSAVTYANDGTIRYKYTKQGYIEEITDQNGIKYVKNEYDQKGRVIKQYLSNGEEFIMLYEDYNRCNTFITSSTGEKTKYIYNKNDLVIKTIYTDETDEQTMYDEWENKIYEKDRKGGEIHRKYNSKCLLLEETLPNGLITQYEYDKNNNLIKQYDNAERENKYIYDENGNLTEESIKIDDISRLTVKYEYDKQGRITKVTDPNGNATNYQYENMFNKASSYTTAQGHSFEYIYDNAGRNMAITSEYGKINFSYTKINYKAKIVDAQGNTTKYFYDKLCNIVKEVLPNQYDETTGTGTGIQYIYNDFDKQIKIIDQLGNVIATKRDNMGNITKEINPNAYDNNIDDGEGIINVYDEDDRKIKIIYPDGGIARIKYDANGNIVKRIQPEQYNEQTDDGLGYSYEYDCVDRLTQITAPDNTVIKRYVYDLTGNIIKEIDAKGYKTAENDEKRIGTLYTYNTIGWLTEVRVPVKQENDKILYKLTQYRYNTTGDIKQENQYCDYQNHTSSEGMTHVINFTYDKDNRLSKVTDCTGATIEYKYDSLNQKIYEKRRINENTDQITKYKYDTTGRLKEILQTRQELSDISTIPVYATTKYQYDKTGNITKITTPKGYEIIRQYDETNRLISEVHKDKESQIENELKISYDKAGNIIKLTDVDDYSIKIEYDLLNREIKRTNQVDASNKTIYNKNGYIVKQILPNEYNKEQAKGYEYIYDINGRLTTIINPLGNVIQTNTYNENGELIQKLDGVKSGVTYEYDFGGNAIKIQTKSEVKQEYEYDARGNITGIVDGNNNKTKYILDKWGKITQIIKPDNSKEYYSYDYAGNITSTKDGQGKTISYNYNCLNALESITDQEGEKETFLYDIEGRLSQYIDRNKNKILYNYNIYGNILSRVDKASGLSEKYEYYKDGQLKTAETQSMRYNYSYYPNRLLKEKSASGRTLLHYEYDLNENKTKQIDVTGKQTSYVYDILDNLQEIWDNGNKLVVYEYNQDGTIKSLKNANNMETCYNYDIDKNLTRLNITLDNENIVSNVYTYDNNGNQLQKKQLKGITNYSYDNQNRLIKAEYPNYSEELFYDKANNRTKRISKSIEETYTYDNRNRLTSLNKVSSGAVKTIEYKYDNQGNLLRDDKAVYTYDNFNKTTKIETFDGNVQINRYDAEGLRHEIEENGKLVQFIFSNSEVVVEKTENDTIRLIRGYDISASQSEQARTYYHYASDETGSTTHIFEGNKLLNYYEYDAFGNTQVSEETVENRFKYTGQQQDPITQQYYLRARYYNPVIARFTQEDVYRGSGLNLYAYCDNNPVKYFDPSGYDTCDKDNIYKEDEESSERDEKSSERTPKNKTKLWGQEKKVTETGLNNVKQHLSNEQFKDEYSNAKYGALENDAMIKRLEKAFNEKTKIKGADLDFYAHELYEANLMKKGIDYEVAHEAAKIHYNAEEGNFYHPDVIQSMKESFGEYWFNFWQ